MPGMDGGMEMNADRIKDLIGFFTGLLTPPLKPQQAGSQEGRMGVTAAKRNKVRYGPFTLKAANDTTYKTMPEMAGMTSIANWLQAPCEDCTLLESAIYIESPNGGRLNIDNGVYFHHAFVLNPFKEGYTFGEQGCFGKDFLFPSLVTIGLSDNSTTYFTSEDGKFKAGNYYAKGMGTYLMEVDVNNYNNFPLEVHMVVEYEYLDGRQDGYLDSQLQYITAGPCKDDFAITHENKTVVGQDFVMKYDGTLVNSIGHLHDGGTNVSMTLNDKNICTSLAHYGSGGWQGSLTINGQNTTFETISSMDFCSMDIPVKAGDKIRVTANCEYPFHGLRHPGKTSPDTLRRRPRRPQTPSCSRRPRRKRHGTHANPSRRSLRTSQGPHRARFLLAAGFQPQPPADEQSQWCPHPEA
ncbi:hypothetical protein K402DRAFT_46801 [Aulographum hederae CBS 113979]|uniref:Uncharacterized protein n=1 Tax=Aulographum hederae CBS 113979 TaxID=1176131 RepID=A0A6G1H3P7_9PEZI|nr:hypothetical protein K402DRAFT_46801 [Aulographum hederae CBS 113979]